jgi:hypothetical protein
MSLESIGAKIGVFAAAHLKPSGGLDGGGPARWGGALSVWHVPFEPPTAVHVVQSIGSCTAKPLAGLLSRSPGTG